MIPTLGRAAPEEAEVSQSAVSRVLVVDEALPIRRAIIETLNKLGMGQADVIEATTAEEALTSFRARTPHVVFTEFVGIHAEDGLEVIHEMLEADPLVKIILVTAEPFDSPEVRAAIRAGVFAFVEKPVRHDKIRMLLQELAAEEGGIERLR